MFGSYGYHHKDFVCDLKMSDFVQFEIETDSFIEEGGPFVFFSF